MKATAFFRTAVLLATVTALAAGCAREQSDESDIQDGPVIRAVISDAPGNKTTLEYAAGKAYGKLNWASGDRIWVNGAIYTAKPDPGDGRLATFSKASGTDAGGDYTAYYPAEVYNDGTPTLPATQHWNGNSLAQVFPMYGTGSDGELNFINICGMMEINLKGSATDKVKSIAVTADGSKSLSGAFTVDSETGSAVLTEPAGGESVTLDCGEGVALSSEGVPFYVALPAGDYILTFTITTNDDRVWSITTKNHAVIERNCIYSFTQTPAFKKNLPEGALPGEFTVDAKGTRIYFSQGNLTYNVSTKTWAFYEHQYDCATAYDANLISLFCWGYNAEKSIIPDGQANDNVSRESGNLSQDEDWGCTIGDGATWRTPSKDEWGYLFNTRTASTVSSTENARYAKATVNGKAGIILLPDTYEHPVGVTAFTSINANAAEFTVNSYDLTAWEKMESAGCVFLPAAGSRSGSNVTSVGTWGYYYSSTAVDANYAYRVYFERPDVGTDRFEYRAIGYSVRLITECQ